MLVLDALAENVESAHHVETAVVIVATEAIAENADARAHHLQGATRMTGTATMIVIEATGESAATEIALAAQTIVTGR